MEQLKQRILKEGKCLEGGILKVDGFINHRVDPALMNEIGKEFAVLFKDLGVNKILTVEASGIAPAIFTAHAMNLQVVFVKKKKPKTMDGLYSTTVRSFTKGIDYDLCVSKEYLSSSDKILFIDDFLANGNASLGIIDLCSQAGAEIAGMGFVIEKSFQEGGKLLRSKPFKVESLAIIDDLSDCKIILR